MSSEDSGSTARREQALAGDASHRRYLRLWLDDGTTVVECRYPPASRDEIPHDVAVRRWFDTIGVAVPAVVDVDLDRGRIRIEDLGDDDASVRLAAIPADRRAEVARRLLAPLGRLAAIDPATLPPWNPPLDGDLLRSELAGFEYDYLAERRGVPPSEVVAGWLDDLASEVGRHPVVACHRDYHLNNLWLPEAGPVRVIDEQGVRRGPDTYDAVSLLFERDALSLLSSDDRSRLLEGWARTVSPAPGWRRRAAAVRLQRGLKVLGTFARLDRGGRGRYRRWICTLEADLVAPLRHAGAPPVVIRTLLD